MANEHYEHAIQGLPCRVSSTAHICYGVIAYRFDTRVIVNGKPNPGHHKSYPGEKLLMSATGKSRQAVNKALKELIDNGLIVRVTIGKPGQRAEFVPIYTLKALGISVNNALHKFKVYKPRKVANNVNKASTMSKQDLPNESIKVNSISTISNNKYGKYNKERFDEFIELLPKDVSKYIDPGSNLDEALDELMAKGMSLETVCEHLSRQKYDNAYKIGGLVISLLKELSGNKINHFESIKWCKKCPHSTRTFVERSPGVDGKDTYECSTCHPNQIRIKERLKINAIRLDNSTDSFADNFGLPPG